ncbi:hypothetical protein [Pseudoclavibacter sp. AY1H1]|uniref:hypothetical protein n=1 Tax=Pseudoclavibacter sp. AY1H1 TaxID=2080584 RepID=UPI000CE8C949|nr:hypothetical protein [Pseudoclavibacter sp. AY1H1]PPF39981.1 hypothetical protein C5E05_01850 [Pseudoclavibacter sp. AY1H1]
MTDNTIHRIFRARTRRRSGETATLGGTVEEIGVGRVKVRIMPELEPVWVRADGITAIGAVVEVVVGTDGRPIGQATLEAIPDSATIAYVGPTGDVLRNLTERLGALE